MANKSGKPSLVKQERVICLKKLSKRCHHRNTHPQQELNAKAQRQGKQFVKQPKSIAKKVRKYR